MADVQAILRERAERGRELMATTFLDTHVKTAIKWSLCTREVELASKALNLAGLCESPLEAAFAFYWFVYAEHMVVPVALDFQVGVEGGYRVDVVVKPVAGEMFWGLHQHPLCPRVAVELDGHEFHERTSAQVTHRNRRDRYLESAGWRVLHFSGSEFNADPFRVVQEVDKRASRLFADAMVATNQWSDVECESRADLYGF